MIQTKVVSLLFALSLLIGCKTAGDRSQPRVVRKAPTSRPVARKKGEHPAIILTREGVLRLTLSRAGYTQQRQLRFQQQEQAYRHVHVARHSEGRYLVNSRRRLLLLDRDLRIERQLVAAKGKRVTALTRGRGEIVVGAEGCLLTLDAWTLREKSRVELLVDERKKRLKDAHGVILHGGVAHVLDNFAQPAFVFRVDVAAPGRSSRFWRKDLSGFGAHLGPHWIDRRLDRWIVIRTQSIRSGVSQAIEILPARRGKEEPVGRLTTFTANNESLVPGEARSIAASTPYGRWLLTLRMKARFKGDMYLTTQQIALGGGKPAVRFRDRLLIARDAAAVRPTIALDAGEERLIITSADARAGRSEILVISIVGKAPEIVARASIEAAVHGAVLE